MSEVCDNLQVTVRELSRDASEVIGVKDLGLGSIRNRGSIGPRCKLLVGVMCSSVGIDSRFDLSRAVQGNAVVVIVKCAGDVVGKASGIKM